MRRALFAACVGIAVGCVALVSGRARQRPTFRGATDRVSIDAVVLAGRNPVPGLMSDDFALVDNGVRQQIDAATVDALPVDVTLAMDVSSSVAGNLDRFKRDIRQIAGTLRPTDRVRVVTFGTLVREIVPMQAATADLGLDGLKSEPSTKSNDGLFYALAWPAEVDRRHLVVAFTDGYDASSALDNALLPEIASRAEAVLYVVLADAIDLGPAAAASRTALRDAAVRTGGQTHPLGDAVKSFKDVFDEFRASYVLRYTLRGVPRAGWHDVAVTVTRPGKFTVRARRGYFGG